METVEYKCQVMKPFKSPILSFVKGNDEEEDKTCLIHKPNA